MDINKSSENNQKNDDSEQKISKISLKSNVNFFSKASVKNFLSGFPGYIVAVKKFILRITYILFIVLLLGVAYYLYGYTNAYEIVLNNITIAYRTCIISGLIICLITNKRAFGHIVVPMKPVYQVVHQESPPIDPMLTGEAKIEAIKEQQKRDLEESTKTAKEQYELLLRDYKVNYAYVEKWLHLSKLFKVIWYFGYLLLTVGLTVAIAETYFSGIISMLQSTTGKLTLFAILCSLLVTFKALSLALRKDKYFHKKMAIAILLGSFAFIAMLWFEMTRTSPTLQIDDPKPLIVDLKGDIKSLKKKLKKREKFLIDSMKAASQTESKESFMESIRRKGYDAYIARTKKIEDSLKAVNAALSKQLKAPSTKALPESVKKYTDSIELLKKSQAALKKFTDSVVRSNKDLAVKKKDAAMKGKETAVNDKKGKGSKPVASGTKQWKASKSVPKVVYVGNGSPWPQTQAQIGTTPSPWPGSTVTVNLSKNYRKKICR